MDALEAADFEPCIRTHVHDIFFVWIDLFEYVLQSLPGRYAKVSGIFELSDQKFR